MLSSVCDAVERSAGRVSGSMIEVRKALKRTRLGIRYKQSSSSLREWTSLARSRPKAHCFGVSLSVLRQFST
ncbi:hypothetical protein DICSQDRAFT_140057 [Dichomitus squalens LYAD-421 SS1]|uniref:Uncharacterized protein n=1 Tax=Dichomitus squalens (strain LYAD-421) TaxID=732165 RepID=R7SNK2_DICSQ|nr:uncharacterized protein DICSQDRAFT_140057 [Dichomitus squalens LYAD-421 SS1]EJF57764.1 hypothetical protein DICSQDRAFT_140057 [Dichomitus squalens LYAD-421 SS1]